MGRKSHLVKHQQACSCEKKGLDGKSAADQGQDIKADGEQRHQEKEAPPEDPGRYNGDNRNGPGSKR